MPPKPELSICYRGFPFLYSHIQPALTFMLRWATRLIHLSLCRDPQEWGQ